MKKLKVVKIIDDTDVDKNGNIIATGHTIIWDDEV